MSLTPWVTRIILANAAMYLVQQAFPIVTRLLLLVPACVILPVQGCGIVRPWSVVTYMFLHAGFGHILFNMLGLFFFGPPLEARLGARRFLALYFLSGIAGAMLSVVFSPFSAIIGASGAVFGVFYAFAHFWPRQQIYIWAVFPVQARVLVIVMTVLALYGGFGSGGGGIAHFAHLGGFLGGFLYLRWLEWRSPARRFKAKATPKVSTTPRDWGAVRREQLHEVNREEYDRIMNKLAREGVTALTATERAFLDQSVASVEGAAAGACVRERCCPRERAGRLRNRRRPGHAARRRPPGAPIRR